MSAEQIAWVLTGLGVLAVVLTRLRLRGGHGAGRIDVGSRVLTFHTFFGVVALATWISFLLAPDDSPFGGNVVGIVSLACWWVVTTCAMIILLRWLPSKGRHATEARADGWTRGPWLSVIAHVGTLAGVIWFTWAYLNSKV
ncbi:hypothetical protein [Nocardioides sp. SYSU D00038]|uniref:hypothetical protein n=1 Tax=Nocardioides sp. SYSU D00038 TaxID=2812554 RepID=UPI0019671A1C|nr:hypothetical protein [Nocardioides sp. SYSU D00038]